MKHKLISVCMALCLILSLVPAAAVETKTAADILPAPLHDTSTTGHIEDNALYEPGSYHVSGAVKDGKVQVTITATGLKKHQNGDTPPASGYWVGFSVVRPSDDINGVKYKWDDAADLALIKLEEVGTQMGLNAYVNAENPHKSITLQWTKDSADVGASITYDIDVSGVLWELPKVQPAPLYDNTEGVDHIPDDELCTASSYNVTADWDREAVKVSLKAENLKSHKNGEGTSGYWVGFFAEAPENADSLKGSWGKTIPDSTQPVVKNDFDKTPSGDVGWGIYVNAGDRTAEKSCYTLQWLKDNKPLSTVTYSIDTSGVKLDGQKTITFNYNNGTTNTETHLAGTDGKLASLPADPTHPQAGYTFDGWHTHQTENAPVSTDTVFTENSTVYAHWKTDQENPPEEKVTVTFNYNYTGAPANVSNTINKGESLTKAFPETPVREGYRFLGWYTSTDGDVRVENGHNDTSTENTTLYAHWEVSDDTNPDDPKPDDGKGYVITFDPNGGAFGSASTAEKTTDASGKLTDFPNEPTYAGHTFAGWFDSQTGGNQVTKTENNTFTGNATLYARWTENQSSTPGVHTIIFRDNYDDSWYDTITTDSNGRVSEFPAHGSHRNYTFDGWFDNDTGYEVTESTVFTRDTVVYAYWYYNRSSDRGYISSGGSSGTSSASVPVTTIPGITVSHGTASIASTDAGRAGSSTYLGIANLTVFDVSPLGSFISTVKIPTGVLREIANSSRGLYVKLGTGEAALDSAAVLTLANLGGGEVAITVKPASITTLTPRQRATAGSTPIFDVTITCGGRPVTNLGGGSVTASIPYTLPAGQNQYGLTVFYLTPTGQRLLCSTTYDTAGRSVTFSTRNLSKFMIG